MARIERLKDLHLDTALLARGASGEWESRCSLVGPDGGGGDIVAGWLEERLRRPAPRRTGSGPGPNEKVNLIAVGNAANNSVIRLLYEHCYAWVDESFPGPGGFMLQTVHNPWGDGRNVVIAGGDREGAAKAERTLVQMLAETDDGVHLPHVFQVAPPPDAAANRPSVGEIPGFRWPRVSFSTDPVTFPAIRYLYTGERRRLQEYRLALLEETRGYPPDRDVQLHLFFYTRVLCWDLLEEEPVFSDEERLAITNALYGILCSTEGVRWPPLHEQMANATPRQNHWTLVALALFLGARYFRNGYGLPEAAEWEEAAEKVFQAHRNMSKPMCDSYAMQWERTLDNVATYSLARGDRSFWESGALRRAAERALVATDPLGLMPPVGDLSSIASAVSFLSKAAHVYRDGRYEYALRKLPPGQLYEASEILRGFATGTSPTEPTDHVGITVAPLERAFVDALIAREGIDHSRTFDKLSLRNGWDPCSRYLSFDGVSQGSHSYDDAGSLICLVDRGAYLLLNIDNQHGSRRADHMVVVISRDGLAVEPLGVAYLASAAESGGIWYVRLEVPMKGPATWSRHLLCSKRGPIFLLDEVGAEEAGNFTVDSYLRCPGRAELLGRDGLRASVASYHDASRRVGLRLRCLEDLDLSLGQTESHAEILRAYCPHDGPALNVLRESWTGDLRSGDRVTISNLLVVEDAERTAECDVRRVADGVVRWSGMTGSGCAAICGPGWRDHGLLLDGYLVRARACWTEEGALRAFDCLSVEGPDLFFWARTPLALSVEPSSGNVELVSSKPVQVLVGRSESTAREQAFEAGRHTISPGRSRLAGARHAEVRLEELESPSGGVGTVTAVSSGASALFLGDERGGVYRLDYEADAVVPLFRAAGRVNELAIAEVDGDGGESVLVASDDCALHCLGSDGAPVWSFSPEFGQQHYPWWTFGKPVVRRVQVADLDGDGFSEAVLAVGNMRLHCLKIAGGKPREAWQFLVRYGLFGTFTLEDIDGDGRLEIIGGTCPGMSCYSTCRVIDAEGRERASIDLKEGWTSALSALWIDPCGAGGGSAEASRKIVLGTYAGLICAIQLRSKSLSHDRLWGLKVGGCVLELRALPATGGDLLAITDGRLLLRVSADGTRAWSRALEGVPAVLEIAPDGRCVWVGCRSGTWAEVGADGWPRASGRLPGALVGVARGKERGSLIVQQGSRLWRGRLPWHRSC